MSLDDRVEVPEAVADALEIIPEVRERIRESAAESTARGSRPESRIVESDEAFIQGAHRRIGQERRRPGKSLLHLEVVHIHEDPARVPRPGEYPDFGSRVEDRLGFFVKGCGGFPGVNL